MLMHLHYIVLQILHKYSQVFIRELISNASDALEKRRCFELGLGGQAGEEVAKSEAPYELRIETDASNRRLVFTDTGLKLIVVIFSYAQFRHWNE